MKVAIVTTEYPTIESPNSGVFVRMNAQAIGMNHQVTVVHLRSEAAGGEESHYADANVDVRGFPNTMRAPEDFERAAQIVYALAPGFDIIHTMNQRSLIPFGLPERENEQLACAWVHTEPWQLTSPMDWPQEVLPVEEILLRPDGLTAPAVKMLENIAARRFASYTAAVPYIVPSPLYPPVPQLAGVPSPAPANSEFAPRPRVAGQLRLVSVGAVNAKHQPEVAIRTVKTLRAAGVDATLTWVGEGVAKIRSQEKIKELKLEEYVRFVSAAEVGVTAALNAADLFIGPTKEENFYVPALQALLAGRPLVLGEGARDLQWIGADTERFVRIVSEKNSKVWAQACQELQAATAAIEPREIAETEGDRYSPSAIAAEYDEVYAETMAASGFAR
ncbi:glycosyltransferase family 4 protein [Mobiluncus curtisii]|uniref:glycosyltransferase family 4 protein n=1 Tax=Mobiluncus curtisii TaxID=2051 RepID=UPI001F30DB7B|nr:glycosyltransferase family 4 protein [Mobiluncus curtisii]